MNLTLLKVMMSSISGWSEDNFDPRVVPHFLQFMVSERDPRQSQTQKRGGKTVHTTCVCVCVCVYVYSFMAYSQPGGTSVRNMVHWSQLARSGEFRMFDFGKDTLNVSAYGQKDPPLVKTERVIQMKRRETEESHKRDRKETQRQRRQKR